MHKADWLWEGSTIVLEHCTGPLNPIPFFSSYLASWDSIFPHLLDLWLNDTSNIPTHSWFIAKLHSIIPSNEFQAIPFMLVVPLPWHSQAPPWTKSK